MVRRQIQIGRDLEGPVTQRNHRVNTSRVRYDWPEKMTLQVALEQVPDYEQTGEQFIRCRWESPRA